jgi:hypothetical protein
MADEFSNVQVPNLTGDQAMHLVESARLKAQELNFGDRKKLRRL